MKTINVTKNRTMKLPDTFTMKELQKANPDVKVQTLYQRVQALKKEGVIVERGEVKRATSKEKGITKGRTEIVYSTPEANEGHNLIRQAKAQGRIRSDVAKETVTEETPAEAQA